MDTLSPGEIPKAIQLPPKALILLIAHLLKKLRKIIIEDHSPRKSSTITTYPFSSEEESDNDELIQACASPDLLPVESSKGKGSFGRNTVKSDTDWSEGSKTEESGISPKPTGTAIKTLTEKVGKTVSNHKKVIGINVA